MVLSGFRRFSVVLVSSRCSQCFSVVLSVCRMFSVFFYGCHGFSVVLVGSRRF